MKVLIKNAGELILFENIRPSLGGIQFGRSILIRTCLFLMCELIF